MTAGFQVTRASLDQRAGSIVVAGEAWFEDVERLKAWLDAQSDSVLVALGYTQAEVDVLKSSFTDIHNLRQVAYGQGTQAVANNFFFWGQKLRGIL